MVGVTGNLNASTGALCIRQDQACKGGSAGVNEGVRESVSESMSL